MPKFLRFFLLLPFFIAPAALLPSAVAQLVAPQYIGPAGTQGVVNGVQISWSVGEPITATASAGTTVFTQGFQQPLVVNTVSRPAPLPAQSAAPQLFPNPSQGALNLLWQPTEAGSVTLTLFDLNGKRLKTWSFRVAGRQSVQYPLQLPELAAGLYMMRLQHRPVTSSQPQVWHRRLQLLD